MSFVLARSSLEPTVIGDAWPRGSMRLEVNVRAGKRLQHEPPAAR